MSQSFQKRRPQKPRIGWIYDINPNRLVLKCSKGHRTVYDISSAETLSCNSCGELINTSQIMRGNHPYIVWSLNKFGEFEIVHAIPLTSKDTWAGLFTAYPITAKSKNNLSTDSLALIHQLTPVDIECFQDSNGNWKRQRGGIDRDEIKEIGKRLKYCLNLEDNKNKDCFLKQLDTEIIMQYISSLNLTDKEQLKEQIIDL